MKQYLDLLKDIMENGEDGDNRTGVWTRKVFGRQMRFDLSKGFPLVTTKKTYLRAIIHELIWLLSGDTNVKYLKDNNVKIWDEWSDNDGNLGPVYGHQWRHWNAPFTPRVDNTNPRSGKSDENPFWNKNWAEPVGLDEKIAIAGIDQIADVIERIKKNPQDRRLIVNAWNVGQFNEMNLPPCHAFFQFDVTPSGKLNCQLYQRSADMFLGVPFNIASYALLTMMVAQVTDLKLGEFIHTFGNAHIYNNHFDQVNLQLSREPYSLPQMKINPDVKNIDDFRFEDFELVGYQSHEVIKAPVAV